MAANAIAIVGAGISGLSLAFELRRLGAESTVLEAAPRVGGTIQTTATDGFVTEGGPNGFLDREPATRELAAALGLTEQLRPADASSKKRFVFTRGALREVPSSPPAFIASDILPLGARLRVLAELFTRRAADPENETLAHFARRHLGRTATSVLIDAMQAGIFAGNPEKLSLCATFPKMAELEREHRSLILAMISLQRQRRGSGTATETSGPSGTLSSFAGGLSTLTRALAERLGAALQLNTEVQSISRYPGGWKLSLGPGAEEIRAERLVLAVPAYAAARLLHPLDVALAEELERIEYAPIAVVHLGYPKAESAVPTGFGFLVPTEERLRILGCIFISSIFPWRTAGARTLLTCMVGGARQPELVDWADSQLVGAVREDLEKVLGLTSPPALTQLVRWKRGIPQYNIGHLARVSRIEEAVSRLPGLALAGNAYRGVGLNDCIRNAAALAKRLAGA